MESYYNIYTPYPPDPFKDIFAHIRDIRTLFGERFELDHYIGSSTNTTIAGADGQHRQLTIPKVSAIPAIPTGAYGLYYYNNKLYYYKDGKSRLLIANDLSLCNGFCKTFSLLNLSHVYRFRYLNGLFFGTIDSKLYTSIDGETWTLRLNAKILDIAYGNGIYVACSIDGKTYYSTNGTSWTAYTSYYIKLIDGSPIKVYPDYISIQYGDSKFVLVDDVGYIYMSTTGKFSGEIAKGVTYPFKSIAYSGSNFAGVVPACTPYIPYTGYTSFDNGIYYSTTGGSWSGINTGNYYYADIAYGNSRFVAVGAYSSSGRTAVSTNNGASWTTYSQGFTSQSISFSNGYFYALSNLISGSPQRRVYRSTDGITWEEVINVNERYSLHYENPLIAINSDSIIIFDVYGAYTARRFC